MSWIYKHNAEALAVFVGAAFAMCLGALIHTAIRGYPVPKAAYLACTIVYILAAPVYLALWYHSRLYAANSAHPSAVEYFDSLRPRHSKPEDPSELEVAVPLRPMADAQTLPSMALPRENGHLARPAADAQISPSVLPRGSGQFARPAADARASPTAPRRQESGHLARPLVPADYPHMPRPVEQVAAHPPAARFSTLAPPASLVPPPPPPPPRKPPGAITHRPIGSAGNRASAPPADPARPNGFKEQAVPATAEQPPLKAPAEMRHSILSLAKPVEPGKSVPGKAKDAVPVQASGRGGAPVERPVQPTKSVRRKAVPGKTGDATPAQAGVHGGTPVVRHGTRPIRGPRQP